MQPKTTAKYAWPWFICLIKPEKQITSAISKMLDCQITSELQCLIGQPLSDCWRAGTMQMFEFGTPRKFLNRKGQEAEAGDLKLHIQCNWRFTKAEQILFGSDDLIYPADETISMDDFDLSKHKVSLLDVTQRAWFSRYRTPFLTVVSAAGDRHGGFQIDLQDDCHLQCFPCTSRRDERWRLFGHRSDESHFVVTGSGIEG